MQFGKGGRTDIDGLRGVSAVAEWMQLNGWIGEKVGGERGKEGSSGREVRGRMGKRKDH